MARFIRSLTILFVFGFLVSCKDSNNDPVLSIESFTSSSASIDYGTDISLTAVFSNGTGSIDNDVGSVTSGTAITVSPSSTTTYTFTATGTNGETKTSTVTVTVAVTSPTVSVSTTTVKTVKFSWDAIPNATLYKLYVNPDNASGFTLETDNITGTSTELTLPVHLTDWVNATYKIEAYKSSLLLSSSNATSITNEMLNAIGYFKASNPDPANNFGYHLSLSSDGKTLAVGSRQEDGSSAGINGTQNTDLADSGSVYIFSLSGTTWTQQAYIKADNPTATDYFGEAVALSSDGNTLAVGAHKEDGSTAGINGAQNNGLTDSGATYVFTRSGSTWTQQAYIKASNVTASDNFGITVSLSSDGSTLAVGSIGEDGSTAGINGAQNDGLTDSGATYVFTRSGSTWTQQAYIKADNPTSGDKFGDSVALSGDSNTLAIGSRFEDGSSAGINGARNDGLTDSGATYVFTRSGSTWTQQAYIKADSPNTSDSYGFKVSLSSDGSTLAVSSHDEDGSSAGINGARNNDLSNSGAIYVFTRSGSTWTQQAYIKASNPTISDRFGYSVALSSDGNTLAVGATFEDGSATGINGTQNDSLDGTGAAYVFTRSGTIWTQKAYVKSKSLSTGDNYGHAVSLSSDGSTLAVGANGEDGSNSGINSEHNELSSYSGAVYLM